MKRLIFLIAIVFAMSCENIELGCWICETKQLTQYRIGRASGTSWACLTPGDTIWISPYYNDWFVDFYNNPKIKEYCGLSKEQIKTIEDKYTFDHNLWGIWWNQTTTCVQQ